MDFWQGKWVAVTGGRGFVGSHVVDLLRRRGAQALPISRQDANLESLEECRRICGAQDIVIHMAARVGGVGYNSKHPALLFRENMRPTSNMIQAAQEAGVERFVLVSSACVYSNECSFPTPEEQGFLGAPEESNIGYGWAKRMAEFETWAAHREFGLKAAIVRPYNIYGPRDHFDPEVSHVIPALIRKALETKEVLRVWGNGQQTRSFLYVEDAARGILEAAEHYAVCDPVNLGSDSEIAIGELVRKIVDLSGCRARIEFDSGAITGQERRKCDISKALREFGFKAKVSIDEGLRRTIEWYRRTTGHSLVEK